MAQAEKSIFKFKRPDTNAPSWSARLWWALEHSIEDKASISARLEVVPKTVDSWTTGRTEPSFVNLVSISEMTGATIDWILKGNGLPPSKK